MEKLLDHLGECGLPRALEVMGDRWSFMILRAAFNGIVHFEHFLDSLGIARNILASRLARLVEAGIMQRETCSHDRRKVEYRLTEKGADLLPAMLALRQWGAKHQLGVEFEPGADRRATTCRSPRSPSTPPMGARLAGTNCSGAIRAKSASRAGIAAISAALEPIAALQQPSFAYATDLLWQAEPAIAA